MRQRGNSSRFVSQGSDVRSFSLTGFCFRLSKSTTDKTESTTELSSGFPHCSGESEEAVKKTEKMRLNHVKEGNRGIKAGQ